MPAAQLATAAIELALAQVTKLSPKSEVHLMPLRGKQLQVTLDELPWPLRFHFSEQIDVLAVSEQDMSLSKADCSLELSLSTLKKLQDTSQITSLIQQKALVLEGDIQVAQQFSEWVKSLDIDIEELLSRYTGDVVAHTAIRGLKDVGAKLRRHGEAIKDMLRDAALEEKPVAAHPFALEKFSRDVEALRSDAARLEARMANLEKRRDRHKEDT